MKFELVVEILCNLSLVMVIWRECWVVVAESGLYVQIAILSFLELVHKLPLLLIIFVVDHPLIRVLDLVIVPSGVEVDHHLVTGLRDISDVLWRVLLLVDDF